MFFSGICILVVVQFALLLLVVRFLRASLHDEFQNAVHDTVAAFIQSSGDNPSYLEALTVKASEAMACTLYEKISKAAIGAKGGAAERQVKGGGVVQEIINRFVLPKLMGGDLMGGGSVPSNGGSSVSPRFNL